MMLFAMSGEPENETKAADTAASSVEPELTEEERQLLITMLSKMRDRAAQWMEEH